MVLIAETAKFVTNPVLVEPSFPLATNRITQKGATPTNIVKYARTSLMLNHMPYCSSVVDQATINWNISPVITLSILAANMTKPEYCNLISLFATAVAFTIFHCILSNGYLILCS